MKSFGFLIQILVSTIVVSAIILESPNPTPRPRKLARQDTTTGPLDTTEDMCLEDYSAQPGKYQWETFTLGEGDVEISPAYNDTWMQDEKTKIVYATGAQVLVGEYTECKILNPSTHEHLGRFAYHGDDISIGIHWAVDGKVRDMTGFVLRCGPLHEIE